MTVHLIHGIHTAGPGTLRGFPALLKDSKFPDYGYIYGVDTKRVNPAIVGTLEPYIAPDDVLICHSNGCAIAYDLMLRGVPMAGCVFINAALRQDIARPPTCGWIDVYYNAGDKITEAAQIGAALGFTDPVWGMMGHAGFLGDDEHVFNVDCANTPGMPVLSGHSDFGTPEKFAKWGPWALARREIV